MAQVISISNDVYDTLKRLKGTHSFSEIIREMATEKSNKDRILGFFGKEGIEAGKIKEVAHLWKKWSEKYA